MRLLSDRILVKQDEAKNTTKAGIIISDVAKMKPNSGIVVYVGPGATFPTAGGPCFIPSEIKVGDKVYFGGHVGMEIEIDEEPLVMLRIADIYGID